MEFLKSFVAEKIDIDESEWQMISSFFTKRTYKKGEEIYSKDGIFFF